MSQGAEKFQPPEVGIEPGPQDLKATLYHVAVKAGFYRKAVEVCYMPIPTTQDTNTRALDQGPELYK